MYYNLSGSLTNRIIQELREFWALHPQYPKLPNNIQGKFSFKERPQEAIIVKPSGASHTRLAADNFVGTVVSYVFQYLLDSAPGVSVEWIREDASAIQRNGGVFPSPAGIYFVEVLTLPGYHSETELSETGTFMVDPLLDVKDEAVTMTDSTSGQLLNVPLLPGTLRLYQMPYGALLYEGTNYTVTAAGEITFVQPVPAGTYVSADYRYPHPSTGPHRFFPGFANHTAIPGVVMAFGRRASVGDKFSVIVQEYRSPSALEYGGRWEVSMDLDIWARDIDSQREIIDYTAIYLEGILRSHLSSEGIEINSVQVGGESESIYDDTADDYSYNGSISMSIDVDWSIHVPLAHFIRSASPLTLAQSKVLMALGEDELADFETNFQLVADLGLSPIEDPFFRDRSTTYELIR